MRPKIALFIAIMTLLAVTGCKQDEKVIDNSNLTATLIVARQGESSKISLVTYSGEIITEDLFFNANGRVLDGKVSKIVPYMGNTYLFLPDNRKIVVVSTSDFKEIATIDFAESGLRPENICFANATSAYVVNENSPVVCLVDITNFKLARRIECSADCSDIACSGTQIFVAHEAGDIVSVIDSRTNKVESVIQVAPHPALLDVSYDGKEAIAISLGNGKLDPSETKTAATANFINVASKSITAKVEIGVNPSYKATEQYPKKLVVTPREYAFIATDKALLRINTRSKSKPSALNKNAYDAAGFDIRYNKLILVKTTAGASSLLICDEVSASQKSAVKFPDLVTAFCVY